MWKGSNKDPFCGDCFSFLSSFLRPALFPVVRRGFVLRGKGTNPYTPSGASHFTTTVSFTNYRLIHPAQSQSIWQLIMEYLLTELLTAILKTAVDFIRELLHTFGASERSWWVFVIQNNSWALFFCCPSGYGVGMDWELFRVWFCLVFLSEPPRPTQGL